jgi:hypothetical protein
VDNHREGGLAKRSVSVIARVGCCTSQLYAPGIDPALSAWELDCYAPLAGRAAAQTEGD